MKRGVLLPDRPVPMASAPVVEGRLGPSQACPPCLARPPPMTVSGTRPIAREAQKVQGGQTFPALLRLWRTPEGQQASFVWVQGQSEAPHPFVKYRHHTTRILLTLKAEDEIITVATSGPLSPEAGVSLRLQTTGRARHAHRRYLTAVRALNPGRYPPPALPSFRRRVPPRARTCQCVAYSAPSATRIPSISFSLLRSKLSKKDTMSAS